MLNDEFFCSCFLNSLARIVKFGWDPLGRGYFKLISLHLKTDKLGFYTNAKYAMEGYFEKSIANLMNSI